MVSASDGILPDHRPSVAYHTKNKKIFLKNLSSNLIGWIHAISGQREDRFLNQSTQRQRVCSNGPIVLCCVFHRAFDHLKLALLQSQTTWKLLAVLLKIHNICFSFYTYQWYLVNKFFITYSDSITTCQIFLGLNQRAFFIFWFIWRLISWILIYYLLKILKEKINREKYKAFIVEMNIYPTNHSHSSSKSAETISEGTGEVHQNHLVQHAH